MTYSKYLPVDPDFYDIIEEQAKKSTKIKVFYFLPNNEIDDSAGAYSHIEKKDDGEFMVLNNEKEIRLDRIITINGKPGQAFDEYDNYANQCLSCRGGNED